MAETPQDRYRNLLKEQVRKRKERDANKKTAPYQSEDQQTEINDHQRRVNEEYERLDQDTAQRLRKVMAHQIGLDTEPNDNQQGAQKGTHMDTQPDVDKQNGHPNGHANGYPYGHVTLQSPHPRISDLVVARLDDESYRNDEPDGRLYPNEKKVWGVLAGINEVMTTYEKLSEYTGVPASTVRKIITRFEEAGILSKVFDNKSFHSRGIKIRKLAILQNEDNFLAGMDTQLPLVVSSLNKPSNYSHLRMKNYEVKKMYPYLYDVGFRSGQITQTLKAIEQEEFVIDKKSFHESLKKAEWFVCNKRPDFKGATVRNYPNFIFHIFSKSGEFDPPGYISPEEENRIEAQKQLDLDEKQSLADKVEELAAQAAAAYFKWESELSDEEKESLLVKLRAEYVYNIYKTDEEKLRAYWTIQNPEFQPPSD